MAESLPIVAGMATMPTRGETAPTAIASVLPQVDRLWLFLDRFEAIPDYARHDKIKILRSQDVGDIRANGKLLGIRLESEPCIFFGVDDDLLYPPNYVATLRGHLAKYDDRVVVGSHGAVLKSRIKTYRSSRRVYGFSRHLLWDHVVDVLGSACVAFSTRVCNFDVKAWTYVNMVDLQFALEARRAGLPMISVRRPRRWITQLAFKQSDSIYLALTKDESRQTELARRLSAMTRPQPPSLGLRLGLA